MTLKIFEKAITHEGMDYDVHHVDADNFDAIPDALKIKAHAVCIHNGKMLLVNHSKWDIWSIPGGTRERGETIEETLHREILEETNCRVVAYRPIAYQKVTNAGGQVDHYMLKYMCEVVPVDDFVQDPAGHVGKIKWIDPAHFEEYIEKKEFKKSVIRRAMELLSLSRGRPSLK